MSMVLTLGPALACRGVYSRKFKDQRPVLISTLSMETAKELGRSKWVSSV